MLNESILKTLLPDTPVRVSEVTVSTNSDAKEWLMQGATHGSLIIARRQTGGKGRMGRSFASAEGGLYMSIVLRSPCGAGELTTLCAVAVRRAVRQLTGIILDIKWVNDLLHNGKKVCGILCEGVWNGSIPLGYVAGIGLNVSQKEFPPDLKDIAASLYPDGNAPAGPEVFASEIHKEIIRLLPGSPGHMAEYRSACLTLGKQIRWKKEEKTYTGIARDIDNNGSLIAETEDGTFRIRSGEVSLEK